MTDNDFILIALRYFRNNNNEGSSVKEIFPDLFDTYGREFLEATLYKYPFFSISQSINSMSEIQLFPDVFSNVFIQGADDYFSEHVKDLIEKERVNNLGVAQMESVIATNKSVQSTNTFQRNILWVTAGISAITLLITTLDYCKDKAVTLTPSPVILQSPPPSKDSMIKLIQSLIPQKDTGR